MSWSLLRRLGHVVERDEVAEVACAEKRAGLRARGFLTTGLSRGGLNDEAADQLLDAARSAQTPSLQHAALFALGMSAHSHLVELCQDEPESSRRGALWWRKIGSALHDDDVPTRAADSVAAPRQQRQLTRLRHQPTRRVPHLAVLLEHPARHVAGEVADLEPSRRRTSPNVGGELQGRRPARLARGRRSPAAARRPPSAARSGRARGRRSAGTTHSAPRARSAGPTVQPTWSGWKRMSKRSISCAILRSSGGARSLETHSSNGGRSNSAAVVRTSVVGAAEVAVRRERGDPGGVALAQVGGDGGDPTALAQYVDLDGGRARRPGRQEVGTHRERVRLARKRGADGVADHRELVAAVDASADQPAGRQVGVVAPVTRRARPGSASRTHAP